MIKIISEASPYREPILKKIDKNFKDLKEDFYNNKVKKDLIKNIKQFTGSKQIFISIKKNMFNAYVIPIYTNELFKIKNIKSNKMLDTDISNNKYIQKIYITFGDKIIDELSSRELTAVLLHELGHVYLHKTNVFKIMTKLLLISGMLPSFILLGTTLPIVLIMRSLYFFDHIEEYNADKYATKYGYGDEIIKLTNKFHNIQTKNKSKIRLIFEKTFKLIFGTTHPENQKRACKAAKDMFKEYKKLYPNQTKELTIILDNLKCQI